MRSDTGAVDAILHIMYPLPAFSTMIVVVTAVGIAFWWPRRLVPMAAGAATAAVVSLATTAVYPGPGNNAVAYWLLAETAAGLCVVAQVVRWAPARTPALIAGPVALAIGISPLRVGRWLSPPAPIAELVVVCAGWTLLALIAATAGLYLRGLDRERVRSVDAARHAQRTQLARDLHDWLAHEMTGIVLAAQAGRLGASDPRATARAFGDIETAGTRGLEAMDRALRLLRDASGGPHGMAERRATHAEVADVVRRFTASSPAEVDVALDADLDELRPEVVATVHRVVVESLTNVRRHAPTSALVRIAVTRMGTAVRITVFNTGGRATHRSRPPGSPRGTGLVSLNKSVEALGGTLLAGPNTGPDAVAGWTVLAEVPA